MSLVSISAITKKLKSTWFNLTCNFNSLDCMFCLLSNIYYSNTPFDFLIFFIKDALSTIISNSLNILKSTTWILRPQNTQVVLPKCFPLSSFHHFTIFFSLLLRNVWILNKIEGNKKMNLQSIKNRSFQNSFKSFMNYLSYLTDPEFFSFQKQTPCQQSARS